MSFSNSPIEIENLTYSYGNIEALSNLNLTVAAGRCHGLFGRNGAGKTTTIKCLLNLLRPQQGRVRVFGRDVRKDELAIKRQLAYVPDQVAFYPWMTVRETLDYLASFRKQWNRTIERDLLYRFKLDPNVRAAALSKGQRTQVALIAAVCPETDLLVLDEPTSGLDPIVRREFIETVIGAFQDSSPVNRTILVSTHLIAEFEGLIDEFTIIDRGKSVLTSEADEARGRFMRIRARFSNLLPDFSTAGALCIRRSGRELEMVMNDGGAELLQRVHECNPEAVTTESLTLEEIFTVTLQPQQAG